MNTRKYWPLDMDPEGQIYDNVAWDLPGFRRRPRGSRKSGADLTRRVAPLVAR